MRELLEEVLDLQHQFSSANTPAMQRRGHLIRGEIAEWLREREQQLRASFGGFRGRLAVQGKDGTGLKTWVPWVRLYTPELSPSPQEGWYVVYLFRPDGEGVALCVSHGSTKWDGVTFKPRSAGEAARLMAWSRNLLSTGATKAGLSVGVDLGSNSGLARPYEATTAFSKMYSREAVPDPSQLLFDLQNALDLLGQLYRQTTLGRAPDVPGPELLEAVESADRASRPGAKLSSRGQGRGLSAEQRALVEHRAMRLAEEWMGGSTAPRENLEGRLVVHPDLLQQRTCGHEGSHEEPLVRLGVHRCRLRCAVHGVRPIGPTVKVIFSNLIFDHHTAA